MRSSAGWESDASGTPKISGALGETGPPLGDVAAPSGAETVGLVVSLRLIHLGERERPHQMPQRGEQKSPVICRLEETVNSVAQTLQARVVPGTYFRLVGMSGMPYLLRLT